MVVDIYLIEKEIIQAIIVDNEKKFMCWTVNDENLKIE